MGLFSSLFGAKKRDLEESFVTECLNTPDLVLRSLADEAYEGVLKLAKARGWTPVQCSEAANIGTLTKLYEVEAAFKVPLDKIAELSRWESSPFNRLPPDVSKATIIEYIVWRQFPDKADMKLVMAAMDGLVAHLKQTDGNELLEGFRSDAFFAWLPWRKLIS